VGPRAGVGVLWKRKISYPCRNSIPGPFIPKPSRYTDDAVSTSQQNYETILQILGLQVSKIIGPYEEYDDISIHANLYILTGQHKSRVKVWQERHQGSASKRP